MREKQRWRGLLKKNTPIYNDEDVQPYFPIIIGCDVDMKTCWNAIILPRFDDDVRNMEVSEVGDMLVENSLDGYLKLVEWIEKMLSESPRDFAQPYINRERKIPFVAESTGSYTQTFFRLMLGTNSPFIPYMINAGMQDRRGKGKPKTDKKDAIDIAKKGRTASLVGFHPYKFLPPDIEAIRVLARDRSSYVKSRTAWNQKLSALLIYHGVTLSSSYEKGDKRDTPFASRASVWYSKAGLNLLWHLIDIGKARNKEDLHELGEFVDLTPHESEVHLNGFLALPDAVLHTVIQPRLNHIKEIDKRITDVERYMLTEMKEKYPRELEIGCSCPGIKDISSTVIFSESGTVAHLQERFSHVKKYQWFAGLGVGLQITGGKLIGKIKPPGNVRLGWIYRLAAKSVMRSKEPEFEELRNWGLSLQHRKNYFSATAAVARRISNLWYHAMLKGELCSLEHCNFHAVRDSRKRDIEKMTKVLTGMNITEEMTVEESLQLGQLANVIGKGLGQNTVYVINPEKKPVLPIKKVEDVFCRNKNENRIAYFLKKAGIFELETLVARAMTSTLITLPQIGKKTVDLIIDRLIKGEYIFDVTDKSYQEKRYLQRNEISDPDKFVPMKLTSVEEANMF
jgi:hypothetical protein